MLQAPNLAKLTLLSEAILSINDIVSSSFEVIQWSVCFTSISFQPPFRYFKLQIAFPKTALDHLNKALHLAPSVTTKAKVSLQQAIFYSQEASAEGTQRSTAVDRTSGEKAENGTWHTGRYGGG